MKKFSDLSKDELAEAQTIHDKSIIANGINVTFLVNFVDEHVDDMLKGGLTYTANVFSKRYDSLQQVLKLLVGFRKRFEQMKDTVILTLKAEDIVRAKKKGKLAVALALDVWHPTLSIESSYLYEDLELVWMLHELGLRQIHPLYYGRNIIGDGAAEAGFGRDGGLSRYGRRLINKLNEVGVLMDVAHASPLSILDSCEESNKPLIYSHGACRAVYDNMRNINDEGIKAVAETGGAICPWDLSPFVKGPNPNLTVDDYVDHIEHVVDLVGVNHVGLGRDCVHAGKYVNTRGVLMPYEQYREELSKVIDFDARKKEEQRMGHIIKGQNYFTITAALLARGFSEQETQKIIGENLLRVYKEVWN